MMMDGPKCWGLCPAKLQLITRERGRVVFCLGYVYSRPSVAKSCSCVSWFWEPNNNGVWFSIAESGVDAEVGHLPGDERSPIPGSAADLVTLRLTQRHLTNQPLVKNTLYLHARHHSRVCFLITDSYTSAQSAMTALSTADVILKNPIGTRLDEFRLHLRSRCDELGISVIEDHNSRMGRLVDSSGM